MATKKSPIEQVTEQTKVALTAMTEEYRTRFDQAEKRLSELEKPKVVHAVTLADMLVWTLNKETFDSRVRSLIPPPRPIYFPAGLAIVIAVALLVNLFIHSQGERHSLDAIASAINASSAAHQAAVLPAPVNSSETKEGWNVTSATASPTHSLELQLSAPCWVRVTEVTPVAKVLIEGQELTGWRFGWDSDERATIEVRSGCPGDLIYWVDGNFVTPPNKSGTPKVSEVVELEL
jgi:hypothetical protein